MNLQLATKMGIELTYMPAVWDEIADAYGALYNLRNDDDEDEGWASCVHDRHSAVCFFAAQLKTILRLRKVAVYHCGTDPDCVEVPTKPYKSLDALMRRARVITHHAESLNLTPKLVHFNGGGAHIHTDTRHIGDLSARKLYCRRMAVFAAKNPWLSWAFIGLTDNINAEPLTAVHLGLRGASVQTVEQIEMDIADNLREIQQLTRNLHQRSEWMYEWDRNYWLRELENVYARLHDSRKRLIYRKKGMNKTSFQYGAVTLPMAKDYIVRVENSLGTVEFRNFEMPENVEDLSKYVRLVDAIVRHVSRQTALTFDATDIPENNDELRMMPLEKRLEGFKNMLVMLGLDPADYEDEAKQIARRFRHYKDKSWQTRQLKKRAANEAAKAAKAAQEAEQAAVAEQVNALARVESRSERLRRERDEKKAAEVAARYKRRADIANGRLPRKTHLRLKLEREQRAGTETAEKQAERDSDARARREAEYSVSIQVSEQLESLRVIAERIMAGVHGTYGLAA
jgi:hypothetical protein